MLRKIAAKIAVLGEQIRQHRPLVHCITNPIAIHDSANIVLAAGGRPIMAEHPQEVEEIVRTAQVLVLNLGNITDVRMSSMKKAFQEALKNRVPTVLDLVGIQCSSLRLHYAKELLEIGSPTVLKGNMSEMRKLAGLSTYGTGVDAGERDRFSEENEKEILPAFYRLSEEYRSVLLVTGQEDLSGKWRCYAWNNHRNRLYAWGIVRDLSYGSRRKQRTGSAGSSSGYGNRRGIRSRKQQRTGKFPDSIFRCAI